MTLSFCVLSYQIIQPDPFVIMNEKQIQHLTTRFYFIYTVSMKEQPPHNEPVFLVYYSPLVDLFGRFCFNCKADNPKIQVKRIGSMATVIQACSKCLTENFTWTSQPMVLGRHAAGNIMTSFGMLMSGINISQAC